uniref:Uncharacterized protein n=1 Tax=Rhizophora mucronata TaxID=61149 RepID=A0A2P2IJU8_RHIMU
MLNNIPKLFLRAIPSSTSHTQKIFAPSLLFDTHLCV